MKSTKNRVILSSFCAVLLFSGYMAQTPKKKQCARCYDCDMKIGNYDKVDCDGSCFTLEGRSEVGEQAIKRGCLSIKFDDNMCMSGRADTYYGRVCACNGDMCNSANVHRPVIIGMIVSSPVNSGGWKSGTHMHVLVLFLYATFTCYVVGTRTW